MLQFSLVFMLQKRGPRQKTRLTTDIITFGVGNGTILNQDGKMKILSHVACFYSKCLAKMKNGRPAWQCFLTIWIGIVFWPWKQDTLFQTSLPRRWVCMFSTQCYICVTEAFSCAYQQQFSCEDVKQHGGFIPLTFDASSILFFC